MSLNPRQFEQLQLFDPGRRSSVPFRGEERQPIQRDYDQLQMFMTPKEIMSKWEPLTGDMYEDESVSEFWDRKVDESKDDDDGYYEQPTSDGTLHESISREGVKKPVHLGWDDNRPDQILGGHHRIAAAMDTAPDSVIPVLHHKGTQPKHAGQQTNLEIPKTVYPYD